MILWVLVILLALVCLWNTREPPVLTEVKKRYAHLRRQPPPGMEKLSEPVVLTGFRERYGEIGYNVNKGTEIGLCVDGEVNEVFHVLIHELAHTMTRSYAHDKKFWENYEKIKRHCIDIGIYEDMDGRQKFCGKYIRD